MYPPSVSCMRKPPTRAVTPLQGMPLVLLTSTSIETQGPGGSRLALQEGKGEKGKVTENLIISDWEVTWKVTF